MWQKKGVANCPKDFFGKKGQSCDNEEKVKISMFRA
jgi:hypothetical protein